MKAFVVGNTYSTRSICNHDCIISVTIAKRTDKTVTDTNGKTYRISTKYDSTCERISPWGHYSMAPTITATDVR